MADVLQWLAACQDPVTAQKTNQALKLLRRALALYKPSQLAFSFNGGKDSTVLLHLLRAAVYQERERIAPEDAGSSLPPLGGIRSFVFQHPDDFPEVVDFIHAADKQYDLNVEWLDSREFKAGLEAYLKRTGVQAIILGTRNNDPNAADQQHWCPSTEGWPPFMRVNPVFDWSYHDVWSFLLDTKVTYCVLYDQGYTSLGGASNTLPNSALQREDGSYAPAHLLADGRLERAGRGCWQNGLLMPSPSHRRTQNAYTADLLLIGDELLAGKVADSAMQFLCQELRSIGYQVQRVTVLPDEVSVIAEQVKRATAAADVVVTCGGIGPTLDDVTVEGIAVALGKPLVRHPDFESRMRDMFGPSLTAAHLKMAETPADSAQLIDYKLDTGQMSRFPLLKCGANIFVLPGVPHLMRQKWRALRELLETQRPTEPFHNQVFRLSVYDETVIAKSLEQVQKSVGPGVSLGSYPVSNQPDNAQLLITLDSKQPELLREASAQMRLLLPVDAIIAQEEDVVTL